MTAKPKSQSLLQKLESLIEGHRELLTRQDSSDEQRLTDLLLGYRAICGQVEAEEAEEADRHRKSLEELLPGFLAARDAWAEAETATANDFNLFEVMEVAHDEIRHSMILAWLLDRRIEQGTHAQGNLGFRLFLEELGTELRVKANPEVLTYAQEPYWVRREVACSASIVDIEIAARGKFIIHVENKIDAREGENQTNREWRGVTERAVALGIPMANVHAIFLTLDGSRPENANFIPVAWSRIARVLERFAAEARPPEVRLFARHYGAALLRLTRTEPEPSEIENGEAVVQSGRVLSADEMERRPLDGAGHEGSAREVHADPRRGAR